MCWMAFEVEGGVDWMELTRARLGVPLAIWTLWGGRRNKDRIDVCFEFPGEFKDFLN